MTDILWIGLGLAVGVPAVLVAVIPRRMLLLTLIAWPLSPVLVYVGLIAWELVTQPTAGHQPGNALYGLALISPILGPPWLAGCCIGFVLGFCLRLLTRPFRRGPKAAAANAMPPAVTAEHAEWRPVHIGFENDTLNLNGVDVWSQKWCKQSGPSLRLAHITHPNQFHNYDVFAIGDDIDRVRFAACELSNGVWGFAMHAADLVVTRGRSHDNTLAYEHRVSPGSHDPANPASPVAALLDAVSGQVLADCGRWASSRIMSNADGSLFIRLQQNLFDVMFRVDPATREFWNHGVGGPHHKLADLAAAIERARHEAVDARGQPAYRMISPDAASRVDLATVEWANSHWVNSPRVVELATGRVVLDLWQTDWDATASFPALRCVRLDLRRYRRGGSLALELNLKGDTFQIVPAVGASMSGPLNSVAAALEAAMAQTAPAASPPIAGANPWAAWRTAVLIAVGAFMAIGVATVISIQVGGP